jgi:hypothetical protein
MKCYVSGNRCPTAVPNGGPERPEYAWLRAIAPRSPTVMVAAISVMSLGDESARMFVMTIPPTVRERPGDRTDTTELI